MSPVLLLKLIAREKSQYVKLDMQRREKAYIVFMLDVVLLDLLAMSEVK